MVIQRSDDDAAVWRALADPTRRQVLDLLRTRPRTTGELAEAFPMSRYGVMKHLGVLTDAGLVVVHRTGRERWNHLNPVPIQRIYRRWIRPFQKHTADALLETRPETPSGASRGFPAGPLGLARVAEERTESRHE